MTTLREDIKAFIDEFTTHEKNSVRATAQAAAHLLRDMAMKLEYAQTAFKELSEDPAIDCGEQLIKIHKRISLDQPTYMFAGLETTPLTAGK